MKITNLKLTDLKTSPLHQRYWDGHRVRHLIAIDKAGDAIARLAIGYNKVGTAYAYFSARRGAEWFAGYGRALGYGYCKQSGAAADAFYNAGIEFDLNIAGAGLERVRSAMETIAREFAPDSFLAVVEAV